MGGVCVKRDKGLETSVILSIIKEKKKKERYLETHIMKKKLEILLMQKLGFCILEFYFIFFPRVKYLLGKLSTCQKSNRKGVPSPAV